MRLLIDTSGVQSRVSGAAKMRPDFKGKERQATTRDGEPIWTVRLDAIDHDRETKETIWVEVAGEQPRLPLDDFALVRGLVFAPWVGRDGKIKRAFRADSRHCYAAWRQPRFCSSWRVSCRGPAPR